MKMKECRRSKIAIIALLICAYGFYKGIDTSMAVSGIVLAIAGSNAYEKKGKDESKE